MLGDIFLKSFRFIRILYSFWIILEIFRVIFFILWNLGNQFRKKWKLMKCFFGNKGKKLAHGLDFSTKIFLDGIIVEDGSHGEYGTRIKL